MQSQCTVALQRNSLRVCASSYARLYSPEVAGAGADGEVDAAKPVGDDGDRTCGVLHLTARISSADAVCASLRCRAHTPGEHRTLTIPVSSSRLMKVTPCAVAGRCRCSPPRHQHAGSVGHRQQLVGGHDADGVEVLPQELGGIAVR
jgi:hypothetical protein